MFALVLLVLAAPDAGLPECAPCTVVKSPTEAYERVLALQPRVLAVGEYHETKSAPRVPSALVRFTKEALPVLGKKVGALVVETWMLSGKCGETETKTTKAVAQATQRPDRTEAELTALLDRTYALGVKNHILVIDCDDYRSMLDDAGDLDAEASLLLVRRKVEEKALEALERGEAGDGQLVLLYGGAVHNDLEPLPMWKDYAFGPSLARAVDGRYVELDLLVPEYVVDDEDLVKEPWFAGALARARAGKTVLIQPHPGVALLLYPFAKRR